LKTHGVNTIEPKILFGEVIKTFSKYKRGGQERRKSKEGKKHSKSASDVD